jgi:tRNA-splicing ligase RtcB
MYNLQKIAPGTYVLPQTGSMRVPGLIIASDELLKETEMERPLEQVCNVACLPGIARYSIAMPDIHWGYGFPIGGVAAMDAHEGVISPGGVGYDINCGVRLATAPIKYSDLKESSKERLLAEIFRIVTSGDTHGHKTIRLSDQDYKKMLTLGAKWSIERGHGFEKDLDAMESNGCIAGADPQAVSHAAKERGRNQLGSIGSGNHFVEIGEIQKIINPEIAQSWNLFEGQLYILIHSGSRGFGHQVCQDTLDTFIKMGHAKHLPDAQLVSAPIKSPEGEKYFAAMAAAANFAFNNRQQILHLVRSAFFSTLQINPNSIELLYDVCHNIAKFENHDVGGVTKRLCVHRKGATRAFGPGSKELAPLFQKTGQPVFVPGDMGRASYILAGLGNPITWCSAAHGAGRAKSRIQSMRTWKGRDLIHHMKSQGVQVLASSSKTIAEEMPDAYKDVDLVVQATEDANLAKRVARLKPHLVVKG